MAAYAQQYPDFKYTINNLSSFDIFLRLPKPSSVKRSDWTFSCGSSKSAADRVAYEIEKLYTLRGCGEFFPANGKSECLQQIDECVLEFQAASVGASNKKKVI